MGKRLGQHFLRSPKALAQVLAAAAPAAGEPVLEIGPGEGVLTGRLLAAGARVTAIEVDPALCAALRGRWGDEPAFRLVEGDVLRADLAPAALFGAPGPYAVVANIPYYLSTPLLFRLMARRADLSRLVLMVQREIAERLAATPADGKAYGSLSVVAQQAFAVRLVARVPPGAFAPPPKVHSAIVRLEPRPGGLGPEGEAAFAEHVKRLFTRRRKLLLTTLKGLYPTLAGEPLAALAAEVGQRRPDALSPAEHLAVFRRCAAATGANGP